MSEATDLLDALDAYTDDDIAALSLEEFDWYTEQYDVAYAQLAREREGEWRLWLPTLFPSYFPIAFAPHHGELWAWIWAIELGEKPDEACIAVFSRGGAKSTSAEAAVAALGARTKRRFGLYVCDTQAQADDHVGNIGALLESPRVGLAYPELGSRAVGKFGAAKGWRLNRLRTASGLTVVALGLDAAARGVKVEEFRPDLIVFDDLDSEHDNPGAIDKKITTLTQALLPAGSEDVAVLGIQNLPNANGIFARLAGVADEPAEFLHRRKVIGPIPAVRDATFERGPDGGWHIIAGEPTWEGQDLARCDAQIAEWGYTAFRIEAQHETDARGGGMFDHIEFVHVHADDCPPFVRHAVWVDPAVTATDSSDAHGCQVDAIDAHGTIYRLRSWEKRATPGDALKVAIGWAALHGVRTVGIETDQGGDTWGSVYREALSAVQAEFVALTNGDEVDGPDVYLSALVELAARAPVDVVWPAPWHDERKAGVTQTSKAGRVQQMLADYEKAGRIVHVLGDHLPLERALKRFPRTKPFDLADAAYWSWRDLRRGGKATSSGRRMAGRTVGTPPLVPAR